MASYEPYGRYRYGQRAGRYGGSPEDYDYDDRGFFDRAGDEVRSWFGDEEAERRRRWDAQYGEREGGDYGWGWSSDQGRDDYRGGRRERYGGGRSSAGYGPYGQRADYGGRSTRQSWGGRGYSDPREEYGARNPRRYSSSGRNDEASWRGGDTGWRSLESHPGHTDYHDWRQRQMRAFDRDYDDYRRERQGRFESDFGSWREQRQTQRQRLGQVREQMDVVGSDGQHVGTVDKVKDDRIKLTRSDAEAGGRHHYVPCAWVEVVEGETVKLNCTAEDARQRWTAERTGPGTAGGAGSYVGSGSYVTSDERS